MQQYRSVMLATLAAALPLLAGTAAAGTLVVGPGQTYTRVADAIAAAKSGDTVEVMAGTYVNDFAEIGAKVLTLTAVGGQVTLRAMEAIPNRKAILITDTDVTITGFRFIGARVTSADGGNGAGIRYQGGNMVLNDCYFANNQEGMLAAPDPTGTITIKNSEFFHNGATSGAGAGYTHNLYVNEVATLDIENSYFHAANIGHEIKSRARTTIVRNSRIVDGPTGTASYSIDLPNGGIGIITANKIEQGPFSENPSIIAFGEEGAYAGSTLTVGANIIVNNLASDRSRAVWNAAGAPAAVFGNWVFGLVKSQMLIGGGALSATTYLFIQPLISKQHPAAE